jgi:hypothetical protein
MARPTQLKCVACSQLSAKDAQKLHGETGDRCWNAARCHDRRSYYRNEVRAGRLSLRPRRRQKVDDALPLVNVHPVTARPYAVLHYYRQAKDSPLHALGAELWQDGKAVARINIIHCIGLTPSQIVELARQILTQFSQTAGTKVRVEADVELEPMLCPLNPCPLFPSRL